jgi:hypothetical protein
VYGNEEKKERERKKEKRGVGGLFVIVSISMLVVVVIIEGNVRLSKSCTFIFLFYFLRIVIYAECRTRYHCAVVASSWLPLRKKTQARQYLSIVTGPMSSAFTDTAS